MSEPTTTPAPPKPVVSHDLKTVLADIPFTSTYYQHQKSSGYVGVEFENELDLNQDVPESEHAIGYYMSGWRSIKNWAFHQENSLRYYGFEHVSPPTAVENIEKSVQNLFDSLLGQLCANTGYEYSELPFSNSIRTSVHVHFDVSQYNSIDLINFTSAYWLLEPLLMNFCGHWRRGNVFCLRLRDSLYIKNRLVQNVQKNLPVFRDVNITDTGYKYGSVNFSSLSKFHTIEFRAMRGVSSPEDAITWINILERIRQFALKFDTLEKFKTWFKNTPAESIPICILGVTLWHKVLEYIPEDTNIAEEVRASWLDINNIYHAKTTKKKPVEKTAWVVKTGYSLLATQPAISDDTYVDEVVETWEDFATEQDEEEEEN
jgi:hypothetical protein